MNHGKPQPPPTPPTAPIAPTRCRSHLRGADRTYEVPIAPTRCRSHLRLRRIGISKTAPAAGAKSMCQWFRGKIQRCHRWAPGSIPGWRKVQSDTVAEWLRRLTRNQLGLSRAGSSPVSVVIFVPYGIPEFCRCPRARALYVPTYDLRYVGQSTPFSDSFV